MKKTGILGGTFNPIHSAHIMLAECAYSQFGLDKVLFMPSGNPPYKESEELANCADRAEMIRLSLQGNDHILFSDFELGREGVTYTSDTLTALSAAEPDTRFYFIIGADAFKKFPNWHEPEIILRNCALVCADRSGTDSAEIRKLIEDVRERFSDNETGFIPEIYYLPFPSPSISSQKIRKYISYGMPLNGQIPLSVEKYIHDNNLYLNSRFEAFKRDLQALLKPSRYLHTLSVAETAVKMAEIFGEDIEKAYTAGLLHDCAKYLSDEEMLKAAADNNIELEEIEYSAVQLVHAKVGALFAKKKYGIEDEEILSAIRFHTTGRPEMTLLEKILYISDTIEPRRAWGDDTFLNLNRSFATTDIDKAMYMVLKQTYEHVVATYRSNISDTTKQAYDYYKALYESRRVDK